MAPHVKYRSMPFQVGNVLCSPGSPPVRMCTLSGHSYKMRSSIRPAHTLLVRILVACIQSPRIWFQKRLPRPSLSPNRPVLHRSRDASPPNASPPDARAALPRAWKARRGGEREGRGGAGTTTASVSQSTSQVSQSVRPW